MEALTTFADATPTTVRDAPTLSFGASLARAMPADHARKILDRIDPDRLIGVVSIPVIRGLRPGTVEVHGTFDGIDVDTAINAAAIASLQWVKIYRPDKVPQDAPSIAPADDAGVRAAAENLVDAIRGWQIVSGSWPTFDRTREEAVRMAMAVMGVRL